MHKFVCRGTIEERIDALIESKQQLAQDILGGGKEINLTERTTGSYWSSSSSISTLALAADEQEDGGGHRQAP